MYDHTDTLPGLSLYASSSETPRFQAQGPIRHRWCRCTQIGLPLFEAEAEFRRP